MVNTGVVSAAFALVAAGALAGQVKEMPGEMVTVTAKVAAIQHQDRTLTLQNDDGTYTTVVIPGSFKRFDGIKVGDTVTARYYDNVVFRKLSPGEKPVDTESGGIVPTTGTRPSGTGSVQRTITTKITAIDRRSRPSPSRVPTPGSTARRSGIETC
jgi:hypothetical protein